MAKILYISLTGMTESLGESQVVQYLLDLSEHNTIYLLSFEKPVDSAKIVAMKKKLSEARIQWKYIIYSNRFGIFSSVWQILLAISFLTKWMRKEYIQIVHTRSLIPAVMGLCLKKMFKKKLLFDIRGFFIDEKIMEGRLKENSMLTRLLRKVEKRVYAHADHVVTLTHASKPIIETEFKVNPKVVTVIPTCANTKIFKPFPLDEKISLRAALGYSSQDIIILHNGSINGSIDFEAEVKLFKALTRLNNNVRWLILNKGQHETISKILRHYQININKYKLLSVDFNEIAKYLNAVDICAFFIKPSFAKEASAPTKFAEMIACRLDAIANTHYGDMEYYFSQFQVGLLLDLNEVHQEPEKSAGKVIDYIQKRTLHKNIDDFDNLLANHFSNDLAVTRYQTIYNALSGVSACAE